ncbi:suppressor of loss of ypt1 [Pleurotus ostreatus]|uniref:Suppressor of loss of ypt1 n=1 Tax=Pleurotus ostreatus TaxID=5322 RepID=A0A8H7DU18_PLEOS|nr:suppressor of loss of ypt1 [Pleurotus ostreatus]KAF7430669.1 suppressor of loss of ypt1 [Pleurotus ostreatus]
MPRRPLESHISPLPAMEFHDKRTMLPSYSPAWLNSEQVSYHDLNARLGRVYRSIKRSVLTIFTGSSISTSHAHRHSLAKSSLTSVQPTQSSTTVFVLLCCLWYASSALSSNTGKSILTQFRYPVTLTFVQFGFVAFYCLLFMSPVIRFSKPRAPTLAILRSTLPMGIFQVGGHIFSSIAISRIPVSTVHTIKALSPLFTVAAYAFLFGVSYSARTYVSLLPLTIGVMLACSFDMSVSNAIGLLCAFGSALVFVSSNIFFKKIMPTNASHSHHHLDKLNLLLYSSSMAFVLMIPVWMYYDLPSLLAASADPSHVAHPAQGHAAPHSVYYYFFMNGTVHFAQNIIAFVILASTSPVTYSIASLIKRVAVICIAIVYFQQPIYFIQGIGITLTFTGLYMYNSAKGDVERGERKVRRVEAARDLMLPTALTKEEKVETGMDVVEEISAATSGTGISSIYGRPRAASIAQAAHSHYYDHHPRPLHSTLAAAPHLTSPIGLTISTHPMHDKIDSTHPAFSPPASYPSPPPSIDSPPSQPVPLPYDARAFDSKHYRQDSFGHTYTVSQFPVVGA